MRPVSAVIRWLVAAVAVVMSISGQVMADPVPEVRLQVGRFEIGGDNPLSAEVTESVLKDYLGTHTGLDGLMAAADALQSQLAQAGYAFHRVVLPPQTVEAGTVRLELITISLGEVVVEGNNYFSIDNVRRSFPTLSSDGVPNARALARNVMIANRHPAKSVAVKLRESSVAGSVDAVVSVEDQPPQQIFGVLNNIGTKATGRTRLTIGAQHNNLWDKDHGATFTYTLSPEHKGDVEQWGLHYRLPLYQWGGSLTFFYTDSDVDSGTVAGVFDVTGAGEFMGVRYEQALLRVGSFQQSLSLSLESRFFDSNVLFAGTPLGSEVRSTPLEVKYLAEWRYRQINLQGHVSFAYDLGLGGDNDASSYTAASTGGDDRWQTWRFGGRADIPLPSSWLLRLHASGQFSEEPLIPGEQFGLGGASTIRGYDEREVSADSGYRLSSEFWAPPLPFGVRTYGFVDTGYLRNERVAFGGVRDESLSSIGVGAFWSYQQRLFLTAQWGHTLESTSASADGRNKIHFSLFTRF